MRRLFGLGAAIVLASCGGDSPAAPATSTTPPFTPVVTRVVVSPGTVQLTVGGGATLVASVRDQRDSAMSGKAVTWTSSASGIATVSAAGVLAGVAAGSATITATTDGKSGSATVTVTAASAPPPSEFQTTVPTYELNVIGARPTANSATLSVYSPTDRTATVTLVGDGRTFSLPLTGGTAGNLDITGLTPDRAYRFRVDAGGASVSGQFRTARSAGAPYRFTIQADSHLDGNSDTRIYANTMANIVADSSDFLVDLGDTFMSDKFQDYHDAAPMYPAQRYYFGLAGATTPVYLVQGNHDAENGWLAANAAWAAGMRTRYFAAPQVNAFYSTGTARNYFAWTWGDATYIALDPYYFTTSKPTGTNAGWMWTLGREQYDWLVGVLQRNTAPYTFVFLHHLVGGNGTDARGGSEASVFFEWGGKNLDGTSGFASNRAGWSKPIHDLFVQYKVSAVFHGHDHLYVHQERDGIAYQEVPQPSFAREGQTSSAVDYGYLSGTLQASSGHLRITVTPARATVEYIRSRLTAGNGGVVDSYTIAPAVRP
jgi:predicted phosphodiesterase